MFCDNLDSQVQPEFLDSLKKVNTSRNLLVAGETEALQPIDSGAGAILKMLMGQVQDEWLEEPGNLDAWEGDPEATFKLDARMRRILITQWVGDAYKILVTDPKYKDTLRGCFKRTGALITIDGSDDDQITPLRGIPYSVPEHVLNEEELLADDTVPPPAPDEPDEEPAAEEGDAILEEEEEEEEEEEQAAQIDHEAEKISWDQALASIPSLDVSVAPASNDDRIPSRITSKYILICIENEWDLAKVDEPTETEGLFRYRLVSSREYGYQKFVVETHGRNPDTDNSGRWVLLK